MKRKNLSINCKPILLLVGLMIMSSYIFCQTNLIFYVNHPDSNIENNFSTVQECVDRADGLNGHKYIYICPDYDHNDVPIPTVFTECVSILCNGGDDFEDEYEIRGIVPDGYDPKDYIIFDNSINPVDGTSWGAPAFLVKQGGVSANTRNTVTIADMTIKRTKTGEWHNPLDPILYPSMYNDYYEKYINNGGISVYDRDVCIINVRFGERSENSNYTYAIKCREQPGKSSHIFQIQNCFFTEACDIGKQAIYTFAEINPIEYPGVYLSELWYNTFVFDSKFKDNGNSILIKNSEIYYITGNEFINENNHLIESSIAVEAYSTHSSMNNIEFSDNKVKNHEIGLLMGNVNSALILNNYYIDNALSIDTRHGIYDIFNNLFVVNNVYRPQLLGIGIKNESASIQKLYKNTFYNLSLNNQGHAVKNNSVLPIQKNHSNIFWNFEKAMSSFPTATLFSYCCYNGQQMNADPTNLYDSPESSSDDQNNPWYNNQTIPENYMLAEGSICIDKGHPNPNFNSEDYALDKEDREPDDSRYDIGYKYFDQSEFDFYHLHGGWNWVCFPKLEPDTQNGFESPYEVFSPMFCDDALFKQAYTKRADLSYYFIYNGSNDPYTDNIREMFQYETYKIALSIPNDEHYTLKKSGVRIAPETSVDLFVGEEGNQENYENYIGYFPSGLPVTYTTIKDAFGIYLPLIKSIKAETWTWINLNNYSKDGSGSETVPSMANRIIKPKEGLVIKVKEDIPGFVWQNLPQTQPAVPVLAPEYYSVKDKKDYEVIDIMSVENPEGLSEIAVFEDSVCVGAVRAEFLPVQLLVYTSAINGAKDTAPLNFQLHYEGKSNENQTISYQLWNKKTEQYQAEILYGGKNDYSRVRLGKSDNSVNPAQQAVLNNCYPNPFNPTTTISWSMPDKGIAEISVYNIKGQKVKTLTNQAYAKGKHQLIWNGKNEYQQSVSSGIYFIRLEHNGKNQTKKVILMK